ncbi:c-type cytochrome [Sphingobium xenophagum]|uniref:c-type cytochrome n=1 Tax=Sphingobium xenophagum TaxID=121428 RepID=UPI001C0E8B00|nr:c-type cytochrome [Sphingobium xenophagum]QWT16513.1 cytochrome c [Sphingobium xenophagum]
MTGRTALSLALLTLAAAADGPQIDKGRDVYELARGSEPITVRLAAGGWQAAQPAQACRACHGDTGEGLSEGTISAPALMLAARGSQEETAAWLEAALVRGRGRQGKALAPEMPRYRLGRDDILALSTYLHALPDVTAPGVSATELTIRVSLAGAALSDAARNVLASKLEALGERVRADGGIFGRNPKFDLDAISAPVPLIVLAWRADSERSSFPIVSLRPAVAAEDGLSRLQCGSLDPAADDQMRAVELWASRQGLEPTSVAAATTGDLTGKAVVLMPSARIAPSALTAARIVFAPAELAARWTATQRPEHLRIVAGGNMETRAAAARALLADGVQDPREAMAIAVYLEGASAIIDTLRLSGRRLRRVGFCDSVRATVRSGQAVTIIDGASTTILSATDL